MGDVVLDVKIFITNNVSVASGRTAPVMTSTQLTRTLQFFSGIAGSLCKFYSKISSDHFLISETGLRYHPLKPYQTEENPGQH
jgi:hypothetical protein